ncbi:MAG: M55 family metallopeptidase [Myxococcales bacterium]|nr:M55 family metallopeptidase [Myxococcales bacterium]
MRTALLIADLEGVAGVDRLEAVLAGSPLYPGACARLTEEVCSAARGLFAAGFERIRVSDSHRGGLDAPNILASSLPPGVELTFEPDAYGQRLFEDAQAVAMVGMHAPAGRPGFAAHTVSPHVGWYSGGRALSEAELVLAIAAELGIPSVFVSGDDTLRGHLGYRARFVCVKRAVTAREAKSIDPLRAERLILDAASCPPRPPTRPPNGPLVLRFKSRWQADRAARAGGHRAGEESVRIDAPTFRQRYLRALELIGATEAPLARALRGRPGIPAFREDAAALICRPLSRRDPLDFRHRARSALRAFLRATSGTATWQPSERALILHMLEAHAPPFFRAAQLGAHLRRAVRRLAQVPIDFPPGIDPEEAMSRLDALYVLHERGAQAPSIGGETPNRPNPGRDQPDALRPSAEADILGVVSPNIRGKVRPEWLRRCVADLAPQSPIDAWLLGELAHQLGIPARARLPDRALRGTSRLLDLYWLTHLFLLETRYLRLPLLPGKLESETEELMLACDWMVAERRVDLAAEAALCLQLAGEHRSPAHRSLLALISRHQAGSGSVSEPRRQGEAMGERQDAHCTAVALLALAGARSRA